MARVAGTWLSSEEMTMAGITAEGTLWIDLADVFAWLTNLGVRTDGATGILFSIENDALQIQFQDNSVAEVDAPEFWAWVIDNHFPAGMARYETLFGVPKVQGPDLTVTFAVGSETHPSNWATPPVCMEEWKQPASHGGTELVTDVFTYKTLDGKWSDCFLSREEAIASALESGLSSPVSARLIPFNPGYFARFCAIGVLEKILSALEEGARTDKCVMESAAVATVRKFLASREVEDWFGKDSPKFKSEIDLMNRLGKATEEWITENGIEVGTPHFIVDVQQQIAGHNALSVRLDI